jgi:hypothetical protein
MQAQTTGAVGVIRGGQSPRQVGGRPTEFVPFCTFHIVEEVSTIRHQLLGHTTNIDACASQRRVLNHSHFA